MKLLHFILHNPLASLMVATAALFLLSLILTGLKDRRLQRELLDARLRARTLYQRRRLQNEQLERETSRLALDSSFSSGSGWLGDLFSICRWKWVFLVAIPLAVILLARNDAASGSLARAQMNQNPAKEAPPARMPSPATDESPAVAPDASDPAFSKLTSKFDYDHANPLAQKKPAISSQPVSGNGKLRRLESDGALDGKPVSVIFAAEDPDKLFTPDDAFPK